MLKLIKRGSFIPQKFWIKVDDERENVEGRPGDEEDDGAQVEDQVGPDAMSGVEIQNHVKIVRLSDFFFFRSRASSLAKSEYIHSPQARIP